MAYAIFDTPAIHGVLGIKELAHAGSEMVPPLVIATAQLLFEAGCDDATFGVVDGVGYGEFLREAPSFAPRCSARLTRSVDPGSSGNAPGT